MTCNADRICYHLDSIYGRIISDRADMKGEEMDLNRFEQELALELNKKIIREVRDNPTARLINLDGITIESVKEYLHSLGSVTWSIYSIDSDPGDELAAKWFIRQLGAFYSFQAGNTSRQLEPSGSR